jgi:hypothetical protein
MSQPFTTRVVNVNHSYQIRQQPLVFNLANIYRTYILLSQLTSLVNNMLNFWKISLEDNCGTESITYLRNKLRTVEQEIQTRKMMKR